MLYLAIILAGLSSGLRTFTAIAVLGWFAWLGKVDLSSTPFALLATLPAVVVLSLAAAGEYVFDLLPNVPDRTELPGLIGRFITGSITGVCLAMAAGAPWAFGLLGGIFAIAGAFGGFYARRDIGRRFGVKDVFVAVPEDLLAIALAAIGVMIA